MTPRVLIENVTIKIAIDIRHHRSIYSAGITKLEFL